MHQVKQNDTGAGLKYELSTESGPLTYTDVDHINFIMGSNTITATQFEGYVLVTLEKIHTEKVGFFNAEFKVFYTDGRVETFPNDSYFKVNIVRELRGN